MSKSRSISVWYSVHEQQKLLLASNIAGYEKVSTFIRDKSLAEPITQNHPSIDNEKLNTLITRIESIEINQNKIEALLAMMLLLIQKRSTTNEIVTTILECKNTHNADTLLIESMPKFAEILNQFINNKS